MAQLAIRGHATRGSEVIELLEMLGGVNKHQIGAIRQTYIYFVDEDGIIRLLQINQLLPEQYIVYSLEEFEEKFPYKVGEKVLYKPDNKTYFIIKMFWENDKILYDLSDEVCLKGCTMFYPLISDVDVVKLQSYKEENYCQVIGNDTSSNGVNTSASSIKEKTIDKTKFPYEIGTRVSVKSPHIKKLATIVGLSYNSCACMQYEIQFDGEDVVVHYPTDLMTPIITEQSMEEKDEKSANHIFDTEIISFDIAQKDKYELDLQGKFEVVLREGKYYVERIKPQYPKTYEECCDVLGIDTQFCMKYLHHGTFSYKEKIIYNMQELLICRDAYWKVAGEQMGLSEPWKYDISKNEFSSAISYQYGHIQKYGIRHKNVILAFPTAKMRDMFYVNFKDLIEQCKELL